MPEERLDAHEGEEQAAAAGGEPTAEEREAMRRFEEELGKLTVADHLALMMHSLSSLAVERMGFSAETEPRKDLDQARLAIDGFRALLGLLEGKRPAEEMAAHKAALSQLQMAYVGALSPVQRAEGPAGETLSGKATSGEAARDRVPGGEAAEGGQADGGASEDGGAENGGPDTP